MKYPLFWFSLTVARIRASSQRTFRPLLCFIGVSQVVFCFSFVPSLPFPIFHSRFSFSFFPFPIFRSRFRWFSLSEFWEYQITGKR